MEQFTGAFEREDNGVTNERKALIALGVGAVALGLWMVPWDLINELFGASFVNVGIALIAGGALLFGALSIAMCIVALILSKYVQGKILPQYDVLFESEADYRQGGATVGKGVYLLAYAVISAAIIFAVFELMSVVIMAVGAAFGSIA